MNGMARFALTRFVAGSVALSANGAEPENAELAPQAAGVLKTHCYRCHGQDGTNEGGFNFVLDRRQLVNRGKVIPGDPAKSKLFKRLASEDDPMPPEEEKEPAEQGRNRRYQEMDRGRRRRFRRRRRLGHETPVASRCAAS